MSTRVGLAASRPRPESAAGRPACRNAIVPSKSYRRVKVFGSASGTAGRAGAGVGVVERQTPAARPRRTRRLEREVVAILGRQHRRARAVELGQHREHDRLERHAAAHPRLVGDHALDQHLMSELRRVHRRADVGLQREEVELALGTRRASTAPWRCRARSDRPRSCGAARGAADVVTEASSADDRATAQRRGVIVIARSGS